MHLIRAEDCEVANCSIDTGDDRDIRSYCVGLKLGCVESVRDMRHIRSENCRVRESCRLRYPYMYRASLTAAEAASRQFATHAPHARAAAHRRR